MDFELHKLISHLVVRPSSSAAGIQIKNEICEALKIQGSFFELSFG